MSSLCIFAGKLSGKDAARPELALSERYRRAPVSSIAAPFCRGWRWRAAARPG